MTTTVDDMLHIRKLMDSGPSCDWHETDQSTADWLMGNLRCYRDLWANGEWYLAIGYGEVVWHETSGDRWFVSPWFASNKSRLVAP